MKANVYLTDMRNFGPMNEVYAQVRLTTLLTISWQVPRLAGVVRSMMHVADLSLPHPTSQTPLMAIAYWLTVSYAPGPPSTVLREKQNAGTDVCGGDGAATWS